MKFGRFHGIVLIALGLILLFCQAFLSIYNQRTLPTSRPDNATPSSSERPSIPPVFGIFGGLSIVGGALIFALSPKKTLQQEIHHSTR